MLEDEQKKIITYHRIWFVRLIAMIVACQALKQLIGASPLWREEYPFGLAFYTKYARLCNLDDFVKVYGANFWLGLKVLFTCALVCYVLAWIMQKVNEKTSSRLDLFADVTIIVVLIVDFISNLYCFKAHVYAEQSTVLYFVRIAVMIIVLLIHIYEYRRNKNLFDKESKAVHISSLVVGIAFVCVSAFFVGKNFVIYNNYKSFYGAYAKEEHGPDAAYEDKVMNYNECAVANGDELFFFHKTENAICKVGEEGDMSTIITLDDIRKAWMMDDSEETGRIYRLDYYDGYVYFTYYLEDNCFLSRVNVETGQVDEPYSNTAIACAVKDGYLYYESAIEEKTWHDYVDIYRVKIESQIDMNKKELYLGNFEGNSNNGTWGFYANIIYDDDSFYMQYLYNERDGKRIRKNENGYLLRKNNDLKEKGLYTLIQYELPDREQMIQKTETNYLSPLSMIDPRVEISDYVLEYNSYGDKLFYLKQKDGNTELIQTDLDGNNEKVLKQYADCYESVAYTDPTYIFSIMVCEDKLVVMYEDQESNPKYDVVGY